MTKQSKQVRFMSQEDKELLLKDLCARLPYHPIVYVDENLPRLKLGAATRVWEYIAVDKPCKPYLRSMSLMTKEEKEKYKKVCELDTEILANYPMNGESFPALYNSQDWLNAHYFDFRNLIERGLALEAPEDMYNLNK